MEFRTGFLFLAFYTHVSRKLCNALGGKFRIATAGLIGGKTDALLLRRVTAIAIIAVAASGVSSVQTVDGQRASGGTTAVTSTSASKQKEIVVRDDIGHIVRLKRPAKRIISLIPSATETLIALDVSDRIVGRTIYDKGESVRHIQSVGGGLEPNIETILSLRPDLIIGWAAEKRQKLQKRLEAAGIAVFHLKTQDTTDIFSGIAKIGTLTGREAAATNLAGSIRNQFADVSASVQGKRQLNLLYLTSIDPGITAGPKTYIGQIIGVLGGKSTFSEIGQNWPRVSLEEIVRRNPDYIILPVGEFRANAIARLESSPGWKMLDAVKNKRVITIDADLINRPGPRIGFVATQLRDALYPKGNKQ